MMSHRSWLLGVGALLAEFTVLWLLLAPMRSLQSESRAATGTWGRPPGLPTAWPAKFRRPGGLPHAVS